MKRNTESLCHCGSKKARLVRRKMPIEAPLADAKKMPITSIYCPECGVDISCAQTTIDLEKAYGSLWPSIARNAIKKLKQEGFTLSLVERALDLPARTTNRWRLGNVSAAAAALLRILSFFPWLIDVAYDRFDAETIRKKMVEEALKLPPLEHSNLLLSETKSCGDIEYSMPMFSSDDGDKPELTFQ